MTRYIVPRYIATGVALVALASCTQPKHATDKARVQAPSTVAAKVTVGGQPCGVVAAFGAVWVTDAQRATLVRIDGDKVTKRYPLDKTPCELTSGFGALWVATQSGVLDRVDPDSGTVVAHVEVGETSYEPVVAYGSVWVTNRGSNTVSRIDPHTNDATTVKLPFVNAGGIVAAGGYLWVGDDSSLATEVVRLDPRTGHFTKVNAGARPSFVAAAAGSVFVANEVDGTVTQLDERTGASRRTVKAGDRPVNLAVLPGERPEVWVPDDVGNHLTRIDATTGEVVETMTVGTGPAVVAPDGAAVWVTNFGDGTVWRIVPSARRAA